MGDCIYCNNPVGFLRKKHCECEQIFHDGKQNIIFLLEAYLENDETIEELKNRINIIANNSFISEDVLQKTIYDHWEKLIVKCEDALSIPKEKLLKIDSIKASYLSVPTESLLFNQYSDLIVNELVKNYCKMVYNSRPEIIDEQINNDLRLLSVNSLMIQKKTILTTFERAIHAALYDGVITEDEENSIIDFKSHFNISNADASENQFYLKFVKSLLLRDVLNGVVPRRMTITNRVPFILQKNEKLIWLINDVDYYIDKERRHYVGGSQGMSIRIAKGIYYRVGAFKGQPVTTTEKVYMGKGILGFTVKHLYFYNYKTSFRIRYDKIVSLIPKHDGFIILKDDATAKHQSFIDGDGWFSYNLITNLSQMELKEVNAI